MIAHLQNLMGARHCQPKETKDETGFCKKVRSYLSPNAGGQTPTLRRVQPAVVTFHPLDSEQQDDIGKRCYHFLEERRDLTELRVLSVLTIGVTVLGAVKGAPITCAVGAVYTSKILSGMSKTCASLRETEAYLSAKLPYGAELSDIKKLKYRYSANRDISELYLLLKDWGIHSDTLRGRAIHKLPPQDKNTDNPVYRVLAFPDYYPISTLREASPSKWI